MAYPEKGAKYPGQDRAKKIAGLADGGAVYTEADKQRLGPLTYPRTPSREARESASAEDHAKARAIREDNYHVASLTRAYPK